MLLTASVLWFAQIAVGMQLMPAAEPSQAVRCVLNCLPGTELLAKPRSDEVHCTAGSADIKKFDETAKSLTPTSDKVTAHSYYTMYGMFLMPWKKRAPKMLEIGLGCDMGYGPGASVALWQHVVPRAQLWEADIDAMCVNKSREGGQLQGVQTVIGDQGNAAVVQRWVEESGGKFDIVIDDGGHRNSQIKTSFDELWPHVNPGGLYFIEDLPNGRWADYQDVPGEAAMIDVIHAWIEQLTVTVHSGSWSALTSQHKLPEGVKFVFCQLEACVIGKSSDEYLHDTFQY